MAPNQDDKGAGVQTPDTDLTITVQTDDTASTSSENTLNTPEEPSIYETCELPQEPTLRELIQKSCDCTDVSDVTKVKLLVIAVDVGLQHLSQHVPKLTELILDGSVLVSLRDLGCALKCLKILRVNRCGIANLDGTSGFDSLEELYIAKNKLRDIYECFNLANLKIVDASNNDLHDIDNLYFLSFCKHLRELTLSGNEKIVSNNDYRKIVKELIPQLKILDGKEYRFCENLEKVKPGPSILPPLERPKSTQSECNSKENSFMVNFPPRVLSAAPHQRQSIEGESGLTSRSQNRGSRILPEIKKRS